ncbi:MAG: YcaO-related McrA-glycine thioamidation protein [Methanomassiliicoccales archaeon]
MKLSPAPKTYTRDGHRTVPPSITLERVEPLAESAGVTEIRDITDLDRVGIPVFSVRRASVEAGAVSVYKGKGASREQARVSAIMETLERYSAEPDHDQVERDYIDRKLKEGDAVDPRSLILPQMSAFHISHHPLGWVKGFDLLARREVWLPASAVYHPYSPTRDLFLFRTNTNGLASGNVIEEAVLHGICEVVERDAWSICEYRGRVWGDLEVPEGCDVLCQLMDSFLSRGIEVHLKDLTSDVGIPTVGAACDDVETKDPELLTLGMGTHLNPEMAAIRALTEVAQSRATHLYLRSNDMEESFASRLGYDRMKRVNAKWFSEGTERRSIEDLPYLDSDDILDDIMFSLDLISKAGFQQVVVTDLTREELGVPVARVVIPGMEVYAMDAERAGPRLVHAPL